MKKNDKWLALVKSHRQMSNHYSLPRSSSQEDLETISRNKLALLFDPILFELRHETQWDKGIDLTLEIKQHGYYTNFHFAVQLKATATIKANKDGSHLNLYSSIL
jgi:hypothetical protein